MSKKKKRKKYNLKDFKVIEEIKKCDRGVDYKVDGPFIPNGLVDQKLPKN